MSAICVVIAPAVTWGTLWRSQKGWFVFAVAMIVSSLVGFLSAWAMRSAIGFYVKRTSRNSGDERWYENAFLLIGLFVWVFFTGCAGGWLADWWRHF